MKKCLTMILAIALMMAGCGTSIGPSGKPADEDMGVLVLKLTDAQIGDENITGVYIGITRIDVNKSTNDDAGWTTVEGFVPQEFNLLDLTNGNFAELGLFELTAGHYNQIRFMLDIQEHGNRFSDDPEDWSCYVGIDYKPAEPLFVPSGGQSGYKAVGAFEVPVNGEVEVTVDFDVRKALHVTGQGNNGIYILKPTLRLVVDSQAGNISGTITQDPENTYPDIIVFAYEDGAWDISEADEPDVGEVRFPNAVTHAEMGDDDSYVLAYLAYGTYDLVVVGYNGETFGEVLGIVADVVLDSNHTSMNIDVGNL